MLRRTSLSTTLLIAVKDERRKHGVRTPAMPGIKITLPQPQRRQRSAHTVDEKVNILTGHLEAAMN